MKTFVLVDFSNLANIAWHPALASEEAGKKAIEQHRLACPVCQVGSDIACAARDEIPQYDAKLVLKTNLTLKIQTLLNEIKVDPNTWIFVKDGKEKRRYQIFPEYKGKRKHGDFEFRPLAEQYLREMLPKSQWIWNPDAEADDTLASMALMLSQENQVVAITTDKDYWTLLQYPNIQIYSSGAKSFIDEHHLEKSFGVTDPKHVSLCKTLWGDPSDNIPNAAPRMQRYLIPVIQASDGTLEDFLAKCEGQSLSPRCQELLALGMEQIKINDQLVRLVLDVVPEVV